MIVCLVCILSGCVSPPMEETRGTTEKDTRSNPIKDTRITPEKITIDISSPMTIPDNVSYNRKDPDYNMKAALKVKALITSKTLKKEDFESSVTCGPFLWSKVSKLTGFRGINGPEMELINIGLTGKHIMDDPRGAINLFMYLKKDLQKSKSITIRNLTEEEIIIYWECLMFDMEEPLFIIESENHRILIELLHNFRISYLDDYYGVSLGG